MFCPYVPIIYGRWFMSKAWKGFERRCAEFFGGRRNPFSGACSDTGSRSDIIHPFIYAESKWRKRHALLSLWRSIKPKADAEKKIPVICLHEKDRHGFLICLHSTDIERLSQYGKTDNLPLFSGAQ